MIAYLRAWWDAYWQQDPIVGEILPLGGIGTVKVTHLVTGFPWGRYVTYERVGVVDANRWSSGQVEYQVGVTEFKMRIVRGVALLRADL